MTTFKNAFITGASSGIGRHIAQGLASKGTRVVVAARREAELLSLRDEIAKHGGTADICVLDVRSYETVFESVRRWDRELGGFDLVIANAGIAIAKPVTKLSWEELETALDINVKGALATLMAGLEVMRERGHGTLVGMSSLASRRGFPKACAYSSTKAALSTFLESMRTDLRRTQIKIVDIRPGFVDTPLTQGQKFDMPFMVSAEAAAQICIDGIERGTAVLSFPWPMATLANMAHTLPHFAWKLIAPRLPV